MIPEPALIAGDNMILQSGCMGESSLKVPGHGHTPLALLVTDGMGDPLGRPLLELQLLPRGVVDGKQ